MLRANANLLHFKVSYRMPGEPTPRVEILTGFSEEGVRLRLPKNANDIRFLSVSTPAQKKEGGPVHGG